MRYDLDLVKVVCSERGLAVIEGKDGIEILLGDDAVLCISNDEIEDDCFIGFKCMPWHTHDKFIFSDTRGYYIEMPYLEVLAGLGDGSILVCTLAHQGSVKDRWLIHRDYNNEFKHMQVGEQVAVFRARKGEA